MSSLGSHFDPGFQTEISWETDLLGGYEHYLVNSVSEITDHLSGADVFWLHGWDTLLKRRALNVAWSINVPVLMRGENTLNAMPDGRGLRGVFKRLYLEWVFRRCAAFLYIGSENREYYLTHGVKENRLFHMPYAVDNAFFSTNTEYENYNFLNTLGLEASRPIILFAGKFLKRKNPGLLIKACQRINRGAIGDPYLLLVGDGAEEQNLRRMADGADWIKFIGFQNQSDLKAIYSLADVFVLPSQTEPWGLAVNEAMASGTAVISTTDCGCSADLVDDSVGRLIPANDRAALSGAIEEILADRERCSAMGEAARKRVASWSFAEDLIGLNRAIKNVAALPDPA